MTTPRSASGDPDFGPCRPPETPTVLAKRIQWSAERARGNPAFAARHGIQPVAAMPLLMPEADTDTPIAWLRG